MKRASRLLRTASHFPATLHKSLNDYALGAAAAGVAVVALHPPAAAEIVFTPTNERIGVKTNLPLDLNHDGVVDFILVNSTHLSTTPFGDDLWVAPAVAGNGVWGAQRRFFNSAGALPEGVSVGPNAPFLKKQALMAYASLTALTYVSGGAWKQATNRFLGLRFLIDGEAHYGWARLTVIAQKKRQRIAATLTGYAYETVANTPIATGETSNSAEDASIIRPTNLPADVQPGLLALGSPGLEAWRREETERAVA